MLELQDMIHSNLFTFVYKALNTLSPVCFHYYFISDSSVHKFGTCQTTRGELLISLQWATICGLKAVKYFGSKLWNTLPLIILVISQLFRSH